MKEAHLEEGDNFLEGLGGLYTVEGVHEDLDVVLQSPHIVLVIHYQHFVSAEQDICE